MLFRSAGENRLVERRDAGCRYSHQYFPVFDRWFGKLDELQRFITAKLFRSHCTHIVFSFFAGLDEQVDVDYCYNPHAGLDS